MGEKIKIALKKLLPKRKPALSEYVAVLLCLVLLLSTATYSWIKRRWTPQISQDNIRIVAGDALVFSLIGKNYSSTSAMTIFTPGEGGIELKPVSNFSGKSEDFFRINSNVLNQEFFSHLYPGGTITNSTWTEQGETYGYIEMSFIIQGKDVSAEGSNYTKYVFFSTNSKIKASTTNSEAQKEVYKAIRTSITFDNTTIVFVPTVNEVARTHKAINNEKVIVNDTYVWTADNAPFNGVQGNLNVTYDDATGRYRKMTYTYGGKEKQLVLTNNAARTFEDYMGGYTSTGGGTFDKTKALFSLDPGSQKTITLRIWLEGEDPACSKSIKGSEIDFLMGFESYNEVTTVETTGEETSSIYDD